MLSGFVKQEHCPRCGGNMYLDRDYYIEGDFSSWYTYEHCLQCGYIRYPDSLVEVAEEIVGKAAQPLAA
jgi:predicted nucleic-acid-binding Zn-ribbon protein